jgi:hypothetical protein
MSTDMMSTDMVSRSKRVPNRDLCCGFVEIPRAIIYVMTPRADSEWAIHTSYHRDGRFHMKSHRSAILTEVPMRLVGLAVILTLRLISVSLAVAVGPLRLLD